MKLFKKIVMFGFIVSSVINLYLSKALAEMKGSITEYRVFYHVNNVDRSEFVFTLDNQNLNIDGSTKSWPSCASSKRFAVDVTTNQGPTVVSAIIAAHAQGKEIQVEGNGTCSVWGNAETVSYITATN
ncbi:MAG: hypothetical protein AAF603_06350 [Pseudomonadota bacterium]